MLLGNQLIALSLSLLYQPLRGEQVPSPISVDSDGSWYGDDGTWSTVSIGVGAENQVVSVYPNTVGQGIWVIGADGGNPNGTFSQKRGYVFYPNESSTWEAQGIDTLDTYDTLGITALGYYGNDDIWLNGDIMALSQLISVVNNTQVWVGQLGLGIQLGEWSLLSELAEYLGDIPSHSYGYTAGAYYRLQGVPASLTLGGVDQNRFSPNNATFSLSANDQPIVALNSITVTADPYSDSDLPTQLSNPSVLLTPGLDNVFTIDSSTSYLWLPESACDAFSEVLGLVYNDNIQLYTYGDNSSTRQNLLDWNLSFTFSIADQVGSSSSANITLPFQAFDHTLTLPFPGLDDILDDDDGDTDSNQTSINYFPLRKAANNTQYTLGRVFLQEAYLTVDYERGNFSVSQASFTIEGTVNPDLVGILPPSNSSYNDLYLQSQGDSLSVGARVGIGIGSTTASVLIFMTCGVLFWRWRRRRRNRNGNIYNNSNNNKKTKIQMIMDIIWSRPRSTRGELHGKTLSVEMGNHTTTATTKYELPTNSPVELPGSDAGEYRLPAYDNGDDGDDDHKRHSLQSTASSWSGVEVLPSPATANFDQKDRSECCSLHSEDAAGLSSLPPPIHPFPSSPSSLNKKTNPYPNIDYDRDPKDCDDGSSAVGGEVHPTEIISHTSPPARENS